MLNNHVFWSLNLNNSEIFRLSLEDIFLRTLDTYTKKINPPSAVLVGGGEGAHIVSKNTRKYVLFYRKAMCTLVMALGPYTLRGVKNSSPYYSYTRFGVYIL